MNDIPIPGREDDHRLFKQFQAHYDAPAYVRRARQVQAAFDQLVERCLHQREDWLKMVRTRLGRLHALAGDWAALHPWLVTQDEVRLLQDLYTTLAPRLRVPVEPTSSRGALRRALAELRVSIGYFNRGWQGFLGTVDLATVNELRDGYNRYYLLEKECAIRSARLARQGFRRLEPVTLDELAGLFPPLPEPHPEQFADGCPPGQ
jgi:hypothetical protein